MPIDRSKYFARIGVETPRAADLACLETLHAAHLAAIPFENIDVWLGREIRLAPESLERKLIARRRGGYCFEQNSLFAAVVRQLGFEVATLEARVRPPGAKETLPRTHMVLEVAAEGRRWLADVGFGGDGPLVPVAMDGEVSEQADGSYRVTEESEHVRLLRRRVSTDWVDLYSFSVIPALAIDFEVANHFTSTHPASIFRRTLTVQRSEAGERHMLRGRDYTVRRGRDEERRLIRPEELEELLTGIFGLELRPSEVIALETGI